MGSVLKNLLKPLILGIAMFSLATPQVILAAEKSSTATKKVASKSASTKKKQQVSRSGQKRKAAPSTPSRPNLGPTEIVQIAAATSPLLLQSRAALVMNAETGEILYGKNSSHSLPIASITKLMTAMVVLDAQLPMHEMISITDDEVDRHKFTTSRLSIGSTMTREEALLLALMSSENRAAAALGRTYPGGVEAAVAAMNRKAQAIGMEHSFFVDTTGLRSQNKASPKDLVMLVQAAHQYEEIRRFSTAEDYTLRTGSRTLAYRNTNSLVKNEGWNIGVSKTGFINEAGKCLVMQARIKDKPMVIVLMDSWGSYTRIGDANRVKQWIESAVELGS